MSGPVCPVCGGPWHAVCPSRPAVPGPGPLLVVAYGALALALVLAVAMAYTMGPMLWAGP